MVDKVTNKIKAKNRRRRGRGPIQILQERNIEGGGILVTEVYQVKSDLELHKLI